MTVGVTVLGLLGFLLMGCILLAGLHYRHARQQELAQVLTMAVEAEAPLAPALRAYVADRPRGVGRELWIAAVLLLATAPLALLVWAEFGLVTGTIDSEHRLTTLPFFMLVVFFIVWRGRHGFDQGVLAAARRLEAGVPLAEALDKSRRIASPDTVLAAAVGQSTGRLAACLKAAPRETGSPIWLQVVGRLLYPLAILLIMLGLLWYLMVWVVPKFEKIFLDFRMSFPESTALLVNAGRWLARYQWPVFLGTLAVLGGIAFLSASSRVCWHCPGLGRLFRMRAQSRVLTMLGTSLEAATPVPQALKLLEESGSFGTAPRRRLQRTRVSVEQGQALADAMRRWELLPARMTPLVEAAQRARNLPWALRELGEQLERRMRRITLTISMTLFPMSILAIGALVGFVVVSMFYPLIHVMEGLGTW
jgi:type IV pilus assembly protein PilC